jgi:hypothetical protein
MPHLPIILIDLFTEEGVVGRSYLKPYLPKAMKYLIPALLDFGCRVLRLTTFSSQAVFMRPLI